MIMFFRIQQGWLSQGALQRAMRSSDKGGQRLYLGPEDPVDYQDEKVKKTEDKLLNA